MTDRPRRPGRALALVAALVAALLPAARAHAAGDRILIGATLPLTGAEARIGGFYREGYEFAFEQANREGGIQVGARKLPVQLKLLDDTSTQATAVNLADRLINNDNVDFLLGTYASHLVQAQSTVAEQNGMPYVQGGGAATEIHGRRYRWLFGILAPVELLGETLMQWADGEQAAGKLPRPSRVALLWENTAHGKDFRRGVLSFVGKHPGYQVVVDESFELSGKDFGALLGKVKAAGADLFLADAHLPDYITMQRQYVSAGMCNKVQSYGARGSERGAVEALGQQNVAYILSAVWWSPQLAARQGGITRRFVDAFKARYGREPEWYQAMGYETARVLFEAIRAAGSLDREAVRKALARTDIESILPGGRLTFPADKGQQAQNPFVVQQNRPDGSSPIVFPKGVALGEGVVPNPKCPR